MPTRDESTLRPATTRSAGRRWGDRFRDRLRISSWCLTRTDSATTERAPPGPASRATVVNRCRYRTARSCTAGSYLDRDAGKNAPEFWNSPCTGSKRRFLVCFRVMSVSTVRFRLSERQAICRCEHRASWRWRSERSWASADRRSLGIRLLQTATHAPITSFLSRRHTWPLTLHCAARFVASPPRSANELFADCNRSGRSRADANLAATGRSHVDLCPSCISSTRLKRFSAGRVRPWSPFTTPGGRLIHL